MITTLYNIAQSVNSTARPAGQLEESRVIISQWLDVPPEGTQRYSKIMVLLPVPLPTENPSGSSVSIPGRSWGIALKCEKLPESVP